MCIRDRSSIAALIAPLIIIGGILLGMVTPTEAGALAIFYVAIVGFFITRKLTIKSFMEAILETVRSTSVIFVIMGGAAALCWLLKWEQVPQKFAMMLVNVSDNPTVLMLIPVSYTHLDVYKRQALCSPRSKERPLSN